MKYICALLMSIFASQVAASLSQIGLPEADSESVLSSSLLQGASAENSHDSVVRNEGLRAKIMDRVKAMRSNGAFMQQRAAQGVSMSAASNLLDSSHVESLLRSEDESLNNAMQAAIKTKASKRVTLEELIVVEDTAKNAMGDASDLLSITFKQMMAKHQQCQQCDKDCTQLQWRKYKVHTMAQCKQNCKVEICKQVSPASYAQEAAALEEANNVPKYAEPSKFSKYLEEYNKEHGQADVVVDDDDKFEIVWEQPSEQEAVEESTVDPIEQLRSQDRLSMRQKPSEQILKELHNQEEDRAKEAATEKLVTALA